MFLGLNSLHFIESKFLKNRMKSNYNSDISYRIILIIFAIYSTIIILNVGGFFTSFYNINLFYAIVPISLLVMVVFNFCGGGFIPSLEISLFSFSILSYLIVSVSSYLVFSYDTTYDLIYNLRTFSYSIINVYIFYIIVSVFIKMNSIDILLKTLFWIFFAAMLATSLFPYLGIVPLDYTKASDSLMSLSHSYNIRLTGFYLNPNLTGYMANISLVFSFFIFLKFRKSDLASLTLFLLSIYVSIRSFSKTSIIISFLLIGVSLIFVLANKAIWVARSNIWKRLIIVLIFGIFGISGLKISEWYNTFDEGQKDRIDQVFSIISEGNLNRKTTTYRSEIWETGIDKIKISPLLGNGFGTFDYFPEKGQGIHNMYFKIFGEAGIIIGLIYLAMHFIILRLSFLNHNIDYRYLLIGLTTSTLIFNFSNHNAMQTSIISMVYGILLAFGTNYYASKN